MKTLMSGVWKWLLERSTRRQPLRFAAVSLLTPLISASGCGWRFALSLLRRPNTYSPLTIRLMLLLLIRRPPFCLPFKESAAMNCGFGHALRWRNTLRAITRCLHLCVCVCYVWELVPLWTWVCEWAMALLSWGLRASVSFLSKPWMLLVCLPDWRDSNWFCLAAFAGSYLYILTTVPFAVLYLCATNCVYVCVLEHFVLTTRQIVAPHLAVAVCMLFLVCLPVYLSGCQFRRATNWVLMG